MPESGLLWKGQYKSPTPCLRSSNQGNLLHHTPTQATHKWLLSIAINAPSTILICDNSRKFNKTTMHIFFCLISFVILIGIDAFQISLPRSDITHTSSSCYGSNKLSIRMNASSSNESNNKSLFEQAFGAKIQFPWDNSDDNPAPSAKKSDAVAPPPKQRKPRVPRYPSALQVDTTPPLPDTEKSARKSEKDIDGYVQSAMTAAQEMNANGSSTSKDDVKQTNLLEKEPDRGKRDPRLGILLIDHGSKRKASNEHLNSIAEQYHSSLLSDDNDEKNNIVVKAAHMEIAEPSILTTLRQLIVEEKVTKVVCVPYFLSPGKHAMIDVPNLIAEAIQILGEERMLEYDGGVVEITSSKALGTNVKSMLGVVDVLVEKTLDKEGDGDLFHLSRNTDDGETIVDTSSQDDEIRKYVNRVTLLERMLQAKVEGLKTMTNRVTVLEDVVQKLQSKLKAEQENMIEQQLKEKEEMNAQMANLTNTIDSLAQEKSSLSDQIEELSLQQQLVEKCHNATVAKLQETIVSLENEIQLRIEEADKQQQPLAEIGSKEEEETKEKAQQQEEKVRQLQTQLADLLDAYNELEQLQADTEAVVVDYKDQLKKTREMFNSELTVEKEKKEDYKVKWNEVQLQLEEERDESAQLLKDKETEYESLLKAERDVSDVWKDKWEVLSEEQAINTTDATTSADMAEKSDAEWNAKLKEATEASTATIEELTLKLQQQEQEYESTMSRKEEQQNQLQQYLQAELQTYYKTIQNQTAQLDGYEIELAEIETKHKESMLIATNSVEASQKRELDMLNTIEELESELSTVTKQKVDGEKLLQTLQDKLDELEKKAAQTVPPPMPISDEVEDVSVVEDSAEASKEDLTKIVEQLQSQVQALASEMKAASVDKGSKEDQSDVTGNEAQATSSRSKRWRRRILRPWTMFRRNV
eukprot:scaffold27615_cov139-Skeletonema_marinoi.AAC.1